MYNPFVFLTTIIIGFMTCAIFAGYYEHEEKMLIIKQQTAVKIKKLSLHTPDHPNRRYFILDS